MTKIVKDPPEQTHNAELAAVNREDRLAELRRDAVTHARDVFGRDFAYRAQYVLSSVLTDQARLVGIIVPAAVVNEAVSSIPTVLDATTGVRTPLGELLS